MLSLETTVLEDRPGEIAVLLGRSDARSLERRLVDMERVDRSEIEAVDMVASFGRDTLTNLYQRLKAKIAKAYPASDVALVMRGTSPLDWDWNLYTDGIQHLLDALLREPGLTQHPYDRGIWIVAREADGVRLYTITGERNGA